MTRGCLMDGDDLSSGPAGRFPLLRPISFIHYGFDQWDYIFRARFAIAPPYHTMDHRLVPDDAVCYHCYQEGWKQKKRACLVRPIPSRIFAMDESGKFSCKRHIILFAEDYVHSRVWPTLTEGEKLNMEKFTFQDIIEYYERGEGEDLFEHLSHYFILYCRLISKYD